MLPGLKGTRIIKGEKDNLGRGAGAVTCFVCGHNAVLSCGGEPPPAQEWVSSFLLSLWSFPGGLLLTTCGSC